MDWYRIYYTHQHQCQGWTFIPEALDAILRECLSQDTSGLLIEHTCIASMGQNCGITYLTKLDHLMTTENLTGTWKHGFLICFDQCTCIQTYSGIYDCCAEVLMITRCWIGTLEMSNLYLFVRDTISSLSYGKISCYNCWCILLATWVNYAY